MIKQIFFLILSLLPVLSQAAIYEVPLADERFKPVANFIIRPPSVTNKLNGQFRLSYQLPPELVGSNFPGISMTGKVGRDGNLHLKSNQGSALCGKDGEQVACTMQLKNLNIDHRKVRQFILKNSSTVDEALLRIEVANRFASDPVGILRY